jgi:ADP-ribose pyrophosphatase
MKPHGPWKIRETANVYVDPFIEVRLDQVIRPDGLPGQHVVVFMKPGICVLAIDDQDQVYLTREFHYGVGRESLEGVSGGMEPNEDPLRTAQRELQEELGLVAAEWEFLTTVDPFTTIMVSPTRLYLARDLTEVATNPEGTEEIARVVMPLETALEKVNCGEITHAPTCVAILRAELLRLTANQERSTDER